MNREIIIAFFLAVVFMTACVTQQRNKMRDAKNRYHECLESHGQSTRSACDSLRAAYDEAARRYLEEGAQGSESWAP